MTWRVRPPGSRAGEYERALLAIERFSEAYEEYLASPGPETRAVADHWVIAASKACGAVGAVPVHAARQKWGVAAVAFLHEGPRKRVTVAETSRPVRVALQKARLQYEEMLDREVRRRRNPLRWLAYVLGSVVLFPARLVVSFLANIRDDRIPVHEVLLIGVIAMVAATAIGLVVVTLFE